MPLLVSLFSSHRGQKNVKLLVNGKKAKYTTQHQFAVIHTTLTKGMSIQYQFDMEPEAIPLAKKYAGENTADTYRFIYGPLLLGRAGATEISLQNKPRFNRTGEQQWVSKDKSLTLTPVYHLMSPEVAEKTGYSKQVIFNIDSKK